MVRRQTDILYRRRRRAGHPPQPYRILPPAPPRRAPTPTVPNFIAGAAAPGTHPNRIITMRALVERTAKSLPFLLLIAFAVGCGDTAPQEEEAALQLGEDLNDNPSLVAVISSPFGTDTLFMEGFQGRMDRLSEMFPQVMRDPSQVPTVKAGVVNQFVMDHLLRGEAEQRGLSVDSGLVDQELANIRSQYASDSAFQASLGGMPESELRELVRQDILPRLVLGSMMESIDEPTDTEVQAFAEEHARQVQARHILFLVPETAGDAARREIESTALAVLDSAQSGEDFAALARRHSEDPGSASKGGDLGFFGRGEMVEPFEDAVFGLAEVGDVTEDLVETSYGYHIIKLADTRTVDIPDERARPMLVQSLQQDAQREGIRKLKEQAEVRINDSVVDPNLIMRN